MQSCLVVQALVRSYCSPSYYVLHDARLLSELLLHFRIEWEEAVNQPRKDDVIDIGKTESGWKDTAMQSHCGGFSSLFPRSRIAAVFFLVGERKLRERRQYSATGKKANQLRCGRAHEWKILRYFNWATSWGLFICWVRPEKNTLPLVFALSTCTEEHFSKLKASSSPHTYTESDTPNTHRVDRVLI